MHKALSSLLIALSLYLLVIATVLYAYTQHRTTLSEMTTDKSQIVAFDVISTVASKPTPSKRPKPPKESQHKKKLGHKKKPVSKTEEQETKKPHTPPPPRTIKKELTKKTPVVPLDKPMPTPSPQHIAPTVAKSVPSLMPAPVLIHKDPAKVLALKHISQSALAQIAKPVKRSTTKPTKQKVKKKKESTKQYHTHQKRRSRSTKARKGNGTHKKRSSRKGKRSFLATLKARINQNKHYPRIAERRGVTGSVRVRFTILKNGRVGTLSASGPALLRSAAKAAVRHAFPVNPTKAPFSLPYRTGVTLRYIRR